MLKQSLYKRLLSYLYPVRIRESSGGQSGLLELFLYRGQYQLGTLDALYSDGRRYRPLIIAFKAIEPHLARVQTVLLLGSGIGSAIEILRHKDLHPAYTLVDNDPQVLEWALEVQNGTDAKIETICESAEMYMAGRNIQFDLVIVDVFKGRVVPDFILSENFLKQCRRSINPGGHLVLNYIVNPGADWQIASRKIKSVFPDANIVELDVNRVVISRV